MVNLALHWLFRLNAEHTSVTVIPFTADLQDAPLIRYTIKPSESGLKKTSPVMIDKIATVKREKIGSVISRLKDKQMLEINRLMIVCLGLG